jgi:hypothetical protein
MRFPDEGIAPCPWNAEVISVLYAQQTDEALEMMEWCITNGCPVDPKICYLFIGHNDIASLEGLFSNGNFQGLIPWNSVLVLAIEKEHLKATTWLLAHKECFLQEENTEPFQRPFNPELRALLEQHNIKLQ